MKNKVYVGVVDLEKAYNEVSRETLWEVMRVYDWGEGGELLGGIQKIC